jgi:hypothetical protein
LHGEDFLAARPTLKLEDHPLQNFLYCLFNIFASYPPYEEAISSIRNLRARHAVAIKDSFENRQLISGHLNMLWNEVKDCNHTETVFITLVIFYYYVKKF